MKKETITLNPDVKKFILKLTKKTTLTEQDFINSFLNDYYGDYILERDIDVDDLIYGEFDSFKK